MLDAMKKQYIITAINLRLHSVFGVDLDKAIVVLTGEEDERIGFYYRDEDGHQNFRKWKCFTFENFDDLTAYCGLDPIFELIKVATDDIALELPMHVSNKLSFISWKIMFGRHKIR